MAVWGILAGYERTTGIRSVVAGVLRTAWVTVSTFFARRRRLIQPADPGFVELTAEAAGPGSGSAAIELVLPCGVTVRVGEGFDGDLLRRGGEALS